MLAAMSAVSNRVFDIPCAAQTDEGEVIVTPDELYAFLERIGPVLVEIGGRITLEAQRVQVGELAGEPIAVTERVVGRWVAQSPLTRAEREPEADDDVVPAAAEPVDA